MTDSLTEMVYLQVLERADRHFLRQGGEVLLVVPSAEVWLELDRLLRSDFSYASQIIGYYYRTRIGYGARMRLVHQDEGVTTRFYDQVIMIDPDEHRVEKWLQHIDLNKIEIVRTV